MEERVTFVNDNDQLGVEERKSRDGESIVR